ncbi:MAG: hypothetical protein ACRBF0_16330 [Calditrichia bacterium]
MSRSARLQLLLLLGLMASFTFAGVYVEGKSSDQKDTTKMYMSKNAMRMEISTEGEADVVIYRKDKDLCWIIDTNENSYFTITRADLAKINSMVTDASEMMNQQLQQLTPEQKAQMKQAVESMKNKPPAQREMMMKMMPDFMKEALAEDGGKTAAPAKKMYNKIKSGVNVNGFKATHFTATKGDKKLEDIYMSELGSLGLAKSDVQIMESFAGFIQALGKMGGAGEDNFMSLGMKEQKEAFGFIGVPVKSVSYGNSGRVSASNEMTIIEKRNLSDDLFSLDSNWKEKENPIGQMQNMK